MQWVVRPVLTSVFNKVYLWVVCPWATCLGSPFSHQQTNKHHNQKQYSQVMTKCYGSAQTKESLIHKERVQQRDLQTWHLQTWHLQTWHLQSDWALEQTTDGVFKPRERNCDWVGNRRRCVFWLVTDWEVMIFTCEGRREKNTGYTHTGYLYP